MPPGTDSTETVNGRSSSLAGLLADALGDLAPEQISARAKIAAALWMVGGEQALTAHTGGFAPWLVKRLRAHIETNIETPLRLEDVAGLARVSRSHFSRAFKKTFGEPFSRYVMGVRLERARRLLIDTNQSISEIALACGLSDQSHLTRLFHRRYGAPPRAWRRVHGWPVASASEQPLGFRRPGDQAAARS
jgi:AraC-like DNA-binding protein